MSLFLRRTLERAAKTFGQFYLGTWMLRAGLLDTPVTSDGVAAFDLLFTSTNAKAGVVGVALSVATSIGSKPLGPNTDSPSVVG